MTYKKNKNIQGFTLIELSIVLVIIGLLIGGVMTGQSLVKQAKFRAMLKEQDDVQQAMNIFRMQYNALPGDFNNGFAYWGQKCADSEDKCNGNGDRKVTIEGTDPQAMEGYRFWQHLNLAGMYPGAFTGEGDGTGATAKKGTISVNIPASKLKGIGMTAIYESADVHYTTATTHVGNLLIFGGMVEDDIANQTEFSATDAYQVDTKTDDGNPLTGHVLSMGTEGNSDIDCVDTTTTPVAYNLDSTDATPCAVAVTF